MTMFGDEMIPLGVVVQAARDYKLFLRGEMSSAEYYRRHPEELKDVKPSDLITKKEMNYNHPVLGRYR